MSKRLIMNVQVVVEGSRVVSLVPDSAQVDRTANSIGRMRIDIPLLYLVSIDPILMGIQNYSGPAWNFPAEEILDTYCFETIREFHLDPHRLHFSFKPDIVCQRVNANENVHTITLLSLVVHYKYAGFPSEAFLFGDFLKWTKVMLRNQFVSAFEQKYQHPWKKKCGDELDSICNALSFRSGRRFVCTGQGDNKLVYMLNMVHQSRPFSSPAILDQEDVPW